MSAADWQPERCNIRKILTANYRIYLRITNDRLEMLRISIMRTKDHAVRQSIEFNQCKRRRELVGCRQKHGTAAEANCIVRTATPLHNFLEPYAAIGAADDAISGPSAVLD